MENIHLSLIKYIHKNNYRKFKNILDNLNCSNEEKNKIVHTKYNNSIYDSFLFSVSLQKYKFVNKLLKIGANVDQLYNNWTPAMVAIDNNNFDILKLFIKYQCNINVKNISGITPLMLSIKNNNLQIYNYLLNHGANINDVDINNNNILMVISKFGSLEILKLVLDKLINKLDYLNSKNIFGNTPLIIALLNNKIEIAHELLKYDFDINIQNLDDENALIIACKLNYEDIVIKLIHKKCKLNLKNLNDNTALMYAIKNNNINNIKLLLNNNCRIDLKNTHNYNSLLLACYHNNIDVVKLLLNKNIKLNTSNYNNDNSLTIACNNKNTLLINLLLEQNIILDHYSYNDFWNAFLITIRNNDVNSFKILLNYSKNLDKNNINRKLNQKTLLMYACQYGRYNIVKLLLQNNVNINLSFCNFYAIDYALINNHHKIAFLLASHKQFIFSNFQTLEYAVKYNNIDVTKILIYKLNDTDIIYNKNKLIELSINNDNLNIIKILLQKFIFNISTIKNFLQKSLILNSYKCFDYLLNLNISNNIDFNFTNKDGNTLFMLACYKLFPQIIKSLLTKNINIFMKNKLNEDIFMFFGKNSTVFNNPNYDNSSKINYIKNIIKINNWIRRKNYVILFYSMFHNENINNKTSNEICNENCKFNSIINVFTNINLFMYIGYFI